jgi:MFS transporter, FHS family, L-fucose permease
VLGAIFSVMAVITSKYYSVAFIAALGLANSLLWPAIFPLAIRGLGRFTKTGSALMIMAIAGGALIPLLYAWLSGFVNTQNAYLVAFPCYLYILYYGVKGYKKGITEPAANK